MGTYSRQLGNPEQEQAEMPARVNARRGWWEASGTDALFLTRKQLGAGFRVWRSGSRRAVNGWKARAFPLFNRLERLPGVFHTAAAPELFKVGKVHAEAGNVAAAYVASMSREVRNRVRSSSPRWRGTTNYRRSKHVLSRKAAASVGWRSGNPLTVRVRTRRTASEVLGMSPERYAAAHLELFRAAKGKPRALAQVFRVFLRRVRELAAVSPSALRELLAELRRLTPERETYGGYTQHISAAAFVLFLAERAERLPRLEQVPRPPDLLPLPPSAPLAPPA